MLELMRFLLVDLGLFRGAYLRDKPPPSYHDNAPPVYSEKPRLDAAAPPPYVQSECIGEKATMPAPVPQHAPGDRHRSRPRPLSRIERLPPELIEQIFLQCFEPAFAQASFRIRRVLSRDAIYRALTILAFCEGSIGSHGGASSLCSLSRIRGVAAIELPAPQRARLQAAIMRCRWFTFERMRQFQADVLDAFVTRAWTEREGELGVSTREAISRLVQNLRTSDAPCIGLADCGHAVTTIIENDGPLRIQYGPRLQICAAGQEAPLVRFPGTLLAMPSSMLSGSPWTSDRVNFLQTAVSFFEICPQTGSTDQSGACDASGNRTPLVSPWTIRQGIRSAIVESNIAALDVLLRHFDSDGCKVRSRSGSSSDTGISSRKAGRSSQPYLHATTPENTPGDFSAAFTHPSMPLNSICQDHFLTAARCDCDSYVMKTLIKYGSESFPGDHPEVRRYATGLKQRKDAFGDVLLEYYLT